ncbi:alpha-1,2-mannosyltransferase ALG9-like [Asterias amurensis]|uniref:alpha-1,2-mannosyltransferase ALG9-like n=1 Tax=Asterias amurensis TaxID=7602 RepID=UPI003AB4493C
MKSSNRSRGKSSGPKRDVPVTNTWENAPKVSPDSLYCWTPQASTALKILISARFCAALLSNISDCDETFNYWEPTHYIIYGQGFQTWEYSPAYAIRSYAYVLLHALPGRLHAQILAANKILVFYFTRCVLGLCCALCELYFYRGVCKNFGASVGRLTLCFSLFSTGMFISSAAFLPSSFSMYMTMVSMAGWYLDNYPVAIIGTAVSALVGWPFAGALGIPIAIDILIRQKRLATFMRWCLVALVFILVPLVWIDSTMFGKLVIAPLNIVMYNVFSDHGANLYGVEPFHFYFINGFLNFNVAFFMALAALPFSFAVNWYVKGRPFASSEPLPHWLTLMPMYLWIVVFFGQAHKEERFLFPIYPFFILGAAITMSSIQKLYHHLFTPYKPQHYTWSSNWLAATVAVLFTVLSLSRSAALFFGYHTPLDVYPLLGSIADDKAIHTLPPERPVNVCVGKEWYRFPSSFFLPDNWRLQFIESEFRGQLPKQYGPGEDATRIIPTDMNEFNLEETSRYLDISKCHYLIDLDLPQETAREPRYSRREEEWEIVGSMPYLDSQRSHRFFRAFFIPFVSGRYVKHGDYNILKTKRRKISKKKTAPKDGPVETK